MVVRKMTPEERAAWLGNGRVLFGMKRPDFFPTNSQPSVPASPEDPKPLDLQNLPFDPAEVAMLEGGLLPGTSATANREGQARVAVSGSPPGATFDWRSEAAKPGVKLFDVEGIPVLDLPATESSGARFVYARSGGAFETSRAIRSGAEVSLEEFEALLASSKARPGSKS